MKPAACFPFLALSFCLAQSAGQVVIERVEIERMTHAEIYDAIHKQGKTTVLIYNGGTEQRGPHAVLGGHSFMARRAGEAIARRLGNALSTITASKWLSGSHRGEGAGLSVPDTLPRSSHSGGCRTPDAW
jgi:hypothetical protein